MKFTLAKRALPWFFCCIAILPPVLLGQEQQKEERSKWFYFLGMGVARVESEAVTQETIQSYDDDPEFLSELVYWPTFGLVYLSRRKAQWLFGMRDGIVGFEVRQATPVGLFAVSAGFDYLSTLIAGQGDREFKNPYALGAKRETTDTNILRSGVSYSVGERLALSLAYYRDRIDYADDETEEIDEALGRSATIETVAASLRYVYFAFGQERREQTAEGRADSFKAVYGTVSILLPPTLRASTFALSYKGGKDKYAETHPVFAKTREDDVSAGLLRIDWQSRAWRVLLFYRREVLDSNIDFFDKKQKVLGMEIGYSF